MFTSKYAIYHKSKYYKTQKKISQLFFFSFSRLKPKKEQIHMKIKILKNLFRSKNRHYCFIIYPLYKKKTILKPCKFAN